MNKRKNLVALDGVDSGASTGCAIADEEAFDTSDAEQMEEAELHEIDDVWDEEDEQTPRRNIGWIAPALAILAIVAWTGFFGWVHQRDLLGGASAAAWSQMVIDWAIPVLLVVSLWILAMRNSRREAIRFGNTARMLSEESAALELRLDSINRELSLARDFMASQTRDLESLGRVATERLSDNADRLQELIRDNGQQVNAIGQVSDTALGNMTRLRDQLPVVANASRDVANQIGNAGNTARDQLEELIGGFERLNEFGEASEQRVGVLREKVSETLAGLERQASDLDRLAHDRFAILRGQSEEFRVELEASETETLAAIRRRAEELSRELDGQAEAMQERENMALERLQSRIGELRDSGAHITGSIAEVQEEAERRWSTSIESLQDRLTKAIEDISQVDATAIANARKRLDALSRSARDTDQDMNDRADAFETEFARRRDLAAAHEQEALDAMHGRLADFDLKADERQQEHLAHMSGLAERGESLLHRLSELDREMARIAAQGRAEGERLAEAGELLTEKVSQSRAILEESGTFVGRLTDDSVRLLEIIRSSAEYSEGALSDSIGSAERRLAAFGDQANRLQTTIAEAEAMGVQIVFHVEAAGEGSRQSLETLGTLETRLEDLQEKSDRLARQAREELQEAIGALGTASTEMVEKLRGEQAEIVREIAERIGTEGSEAIDGALREGAASAIASLQEAAREAGERGRDTAAQLRDQLAMVNELAGNLERRVAQARERAEERVDHDFTRRMALITESLNSNAIDISKAFDNEVTDTAWTSYLRGDRGIFTRRAVRLLDNHDVRSVVGVYEEDSDFRETVNRYIHDFEAMLRSVLSTRDGNAMAVTLLSSDMGKLYVALAQAIERLRN